MANLNIGAAKDMTFDAIVIGSGISGGWAAKELTEKGLRVLMLERGRLPASGTFGCLIKGSKYLLIL
jgi:choline dehydrogenase-like flavoprotein